MADLPETRLLLAPIRIPRDARERIVGRYPSGARSHSEYRRRRKLVAEVLWERNGNPCWAWGLRRGKKHGLEVEWWENGKIAFAEPWVDGVRHGVARHYDKEGSLLLETRYVHGTGVDLWCDLYNRTLLRGDADRGWRRPRAPMVERRPADRVSGGKARVEA